MSYDISQPIPQGSDGAQDAENSRISAITDELKRLIAASQQSPMSSSDFAQYMKRNVEIASKM